jgi:para-aminobenzoate N-oxygenase AurF
MANAVSNSAENLANAAIATASGTNGSSSANIFLTPPVNAPPPAEGYSEFAQRATRSAKVGPTGIETLPNAVLPVTYTWDYSTKRVDLRALYEKSKDLMWNARTDIDWSVDVDPYRENSPDQANPIYGTAMWNKLDPKREIPELRRHMGAYILSNFLHGEQGALLATAQIVNSAPTPDAKFYAAAQVYDEARHVEVYDRYLREKFELVYPISPFLKQLLDTILTDSRWDFKYLGMQIMVEGVALGAFGFVHQTSTEPLIRQITELIMKDESRHVAFGVLSLKDMYKDMPANELRDREDFLLESSQLLRDRFLGQEVWENVGLPKKECEELSAKSEVMSLFRKLLFSKIVPNVKKLGLLTPYVRKGFERLDVIEYENWEASA